MNKILLLSGLFLFSVGAVRAQKGDNQIRVLGELSLPEGAVGIGLGGYMKFLYGVGASGQVTLTTGVKKSSEEGLYKNTIRTIPVLVGYKLNVRWFYAEPQVGFGELGGKAEMDGDWAQYSGGAFFWAVGVGYNRKRLDLGLRYQDTQAVRQQSNSHPIYNRFEYVGLYAGYTLWRK
jgi:hypothetical protein